MTGRLPHTLRSDAQDNRERILDVARAVFAAQGLNVPMREIARRAGVGPATLYRHFPTKETLATEAFADQMRACQAIVDEGLASPDPWHGFCLMIEKICELHARNRGFTAAFMSAFPDAMDFAASREYTLNSAAELARRAKDAGHLRPDFVLDDLILVLMANRGIHATSTAARVAASRRFAALAIQAFQASPKHSPLPRPAPLAGLSSFPILLVDNCPCHELAVGVHCPALLAQRSGPVGHLPGSSPARNGTSEAAWSAPAPASPAEALAAPAGGRGRLLAVVPVNGGSARLAIVGYLLPPASKDGQADGQRSRPPGGMSANGPSASSASAEEVPADGLVVDAAGYRVLAGGRNAGLVLREFELLAFLAANPGQVFARTQLLARVWGNAYQEGTRTVDVHMHRLRRKLGPQYARRLVTVRHVGYMYQPDR